MGAAQFRDGNGTVFLVRVGGVAVMDSRVLLHRSDDEAFWSLPGGRLEVGETATECLVREMEEEISATVHVDGMLWVVENFFEHGFIERADPDPTLRPYHEVGLYLAMRLPDRFESTESFWGVEMDGTEQEFRLEFRWFPLDAVGTLDLRPRILRKKLCAPLPVPTPGVVQRS